MKAHFSVIFTIVALTTCACSQAQSPTELSPTIEIVPTMDLGPVDLLWTSTGDSGQLNQPSGLALDFQGNLYVVDTVNHQIKVFTPQGEIRSTSGEPGSGNGQFNFAWEENLSLEDSDEVTAGVTLDGEENFFVADVGNSRIQILNLQGEFLSRFPEIMSYFWREDILQPKVSRQDTGFA